MKFEELRDFDENDAKSSIYQKNVREVHECKKKYMWIPTKEDETPFNHC